MKNRLHSGSLKAEIKAANASEERSKPKLAFNAGLLG